MFVYHELWVVSLFPMKLPCRANLATPPMHGKVVAKLRELQKTEPEQRAKVVPHSTRGAQIGHCIDKLWLGGYVSTRTCNLGAHDIGQIGVWCSRSSYLMDISSSKCL